MSWRTTAALFVILLMVAALVVLQNQQDKAEGTPEVPTLTAPRAIFPNISGSDIQRLDIERAEDGAIVSFERQENGMDWYQTVPTYTLAVSQTLTNRLSGLANIATRDNVLRGENPLSAYGLDEPAYTISFVVPEEGRALRYRIFVGNETPTGDNYYVTKEGDPRVFVILKTPLDNIINFLDMPPVPEPTPEATPAP
jgi:hypothetical protein